MVGIKKQIGSFSFKETMNMVLWSVSMNVKIYAIGGNLNDKYVGTAIDGATGLSLIDLIEMTGGYACSVHGDGLDNMCAVSGEVSTKQARVMFTVAKEREKVFIERENQINKECGVG